MAPIPFYFKKEKFIIEIDFENLEKDGKINKTYKCSVNCPEHELFSIVDIVFSVFDINYLDTLDDHYPILKKFMNANSRVLIYIQSFINNKRDEFRGLGKISLKTVLKYFTKVLSINTLDTFVMVKASGDVDYLGKYITFREDLKRLSNSELLEIIRKYDIMNKKDIHKYLKKEHIETIELDIMTKDELLESYSREELLDYFVEPIISIKENDELSDYYFRNFKLQVIDNSYICEKTLVCILKDFLN